MFYKTIFLCIILFFSFMNVSALDYSKLDTKIDTITDKISSSLKYSPQYKIKITKKIIFKLSQLKNKKPKLENIIQYISSKFEDSLKKLQIEYSNKIQVITENWLVSNYSVTHKEFQAQSNTYFIIRSFTQNNTNKYLIINSNNFKTSIINSSLIYQYTNYSTLYNNSHYSTIQNSLISKKIKTKNIYQNYWLHRSISTNDNKAYITADFCPSWKHGFEKDLFTKYQNLWHKEISIAITQAWIDWHPQDFEYLKNLNSSNKLNITWINHTKTHKYQPWVDFKNNFILSKGLKLNDEILTVEKTLIQHWQLPSIFLRFPWLVSNKATRESVIKHYWLIPLWSNAWLAKWEQPTNGSIILIHWNKNEPIWIKKMSQYLDNNPNRKFWDIYNVLNWK